MVRNCAARSGRYGVGNTGFNKTSPQRIQFASLFNGITATDVMTATGVNSAEQVHTHRRRIHAATHRTHTYTYTHIHIHRTNTFLATTKHLKYLVYLINFSFPWEQGFAGEHFSEDASYGPEVEGRGVLPLS